LEARRIFGAYVDRSGNFIDTAVNCTSGTSECILGKLMVGRRHRIVLLTKFTIARSGRSEFGRQPPHEPHPVRRTEPVLAWHRPHRSAAPARLGRQDAAGVADTRKGMIASTGLLNEASPCTAEEVKTVAHTTGASAARVALA
jgi:hypothetical protein